MRYREALRRWRPDPSFGSDHGPPSSVLASGTVQTKSTSGSIGIAARRLQHFCRAQRRVFTTLVQQLQRRQDRDPTGVDGTDAEAINQANEHEEDRCGENDTSVSQSLGLFQVATADQAESIGDVETDKGTSEGSVLPRRRKRGQSSAWSSSRERQILARSTKRSRSRSDEIQSELELPDLKQLPPREALSCICQSRRRFLPRRGRAHTRSRSALLPTSDNLPA